MGFFIITAMLQFLSATFSFTVRLLGDATDWAVDGATWCILIGSGLFLGKTIVDCLSFAIYMATIYMAKNSIEDIAERKNVRTWKDGDGEDVEMKEKSLLVTHSALKDDDDDLDQTADKAALLRSMNESDKADKADDNDASELLKFSSLNLSLVSPNKADEPVAAPVRAPSAALMSKSQTSKAWPVLPPSRRYPRAPCGPPCGYRSPTGPRPSTPHSPCRLTPPPLGRLQQRVICRDRRTGRELPASNSKLLLPHLFLKHKTKNKAKNNTIFPLRR